MKKVLKVLAILAVSSFLFSACKSVHSCPAYGHAAQPAVEQPS